MVGGHQDDSESALRALRSAQEEVEALRGGSLSPSAARGYILRVANAVDRSLRRLLRDDASAELSLRLKALAPDEIRIDSVLAELRRSDRVPMELAASIHELFEARRRLEGGAEPEPVDGSRAVSVVERLEATIRKAVAGWTATRAPAAEGGEPSPLAADGVSDADGARIGRARAVPVWALATAALLTLLAVVSVWLLRGRGPDEMATGIALFESGEYAEASQHFYRHAEANPEDVTPQLYLARIHRRMNRPELAADAIRAAEQIAPDDAAVHRELGFLLLDTDQSAVAIERFRTAIGLDAASSEGWVGLVRALRASGRGAEVEVVIEQAPPEVRALLRNPN